MFTLHDHLENEEASSLQRNQSAMSMLEGNPPSTVFVYIVGKETYDEPFRHARDAYDQQHPGREEILGASWLLRVWTDSQQWLPLGEFRRTLRSTDAYALLHAHHYIRQLAWNAWRRLRRSEIRRGRGSWCRRWRLWTDPVLSYAGSLGSVGGRGAVQYCEGLFCFVRDTELALAPATARHKAQAPYLWYQDIDHVKRHDRTRSGHRRSSRLYRGTHRAYRRGHSMCIHAKASHQAGSASLHHRLRFLAPSCPSSNMLNYDDASVAAHQQGQQARQQQQQKVLRPIPPGLQLQRLVKTKSHQRPARC